MRAGPVMAGLLAAALLWAVAALAPPALAQTALQAPSAQVPPRGAIQSTPLPPPPVGAQLQPGQVLPAVPPPPGSSPPGASPAPDAAPAAPQGAPLQAVNAEWVPRGRVELRGLDKVMARATTLTGKVGETLQFGPLTILVRHCVVRPPDQPPDAAAFLEIAETGKPPFFRGWMIHSVPQIGLLEYPTHDIRLGGCLP